MDEANVGNDVVAFSLGAELGAELGTSDGWCVVATLDGLWLGVIVVASSVNAGDGAAVGATIGTAVDIEGD